MKKDDILSQKQMTEMLNVANLTISDHLKAKRNNRKFEKCLPHELNDRWKVETPLVKFCFKVTIENQRCIELLLAMKN